MEHVTADCTKTGQVKRDTFELLKRLIYLVEETCCYQVLLVRSVLLCPFADDVVRPSGGSFVGGHSEP